MAALTANSWTVTITERHIHHKERVVRGTMEIPGVDTYPTGGIPLPAISAFGMIRNLEKLIVFAHDSLTTSPHASWDKTNAKLQLYGDAATGADASLPQLPNTATPGPRVFRFEAIGW